MIKEKDLRVLKVKEGNFIELQGLYNKDRLDVVKQKISENEYLNDYYINNMNYKAIAEKNNVKEYTYMASVIYKNLSVMKVDLAEEGIFPNAEITDTSKDQIDRVKESISKIGYSASHLINDISIADMEKICLTHPRRPSTKLTRDREDIEEKLLKNSIPFNGKTFTKDIYIKIFGYSKNIKDIPDEEFKNVYELIKSNPLIHGFYKYYSYAYNYYRSRMSKDELNQLLEDEIVATRKIYWERAKENSNNHKTDTKSQERDINIEKSQDGR